MKELRQEGADVPPGTVEDWLEKRAKRLSAAQSNRYRCQGASILLPRARTVQGGGPTRGLWVGEEEAWVIRGPSSMGPPELPFHSRPASAACLLLAHAADTYGAGLACPRHSRMHASPCVLLLPAAASPGKAHGGLLSAQTCVEGPCCRGADY